MKHYVNCYPDRGPTIWRRVKDAQQYATPDAYAIAVEVNLPDPPHQWKVGDWFMPSPRQPWSTPTRIVDIAKGMWAGATRDERGKPRTLDGWTVSELDEAGATPCDPPAWWLWEAS